MYGQSQAQAPSDCNNAETGKLNEDKYLEDQVPELTKAFMQSLKTYNPFEELRPGSKKEDIKDLPTLLRHADFKKWAMSIKHSQPVFFHLMQIYLGTVEASSFVETIFSTAGKVWSVARVRLAATTFECQTILKKGRALVKKYMKVRKKARSF